MYVSVLSSTKEFSASHCFEYKELTNRAVQEIMILINVTVISAFTLTDFVYQHWLVANNSRHSILMLLESTVLLVFLVRTIYW